MPYSSISLPTGSAATDQLDPSVALAQKKIYGATEGRAQQVQNDPYQKSAMDYLQGVVGGANVPYSDQVKDSILAQQGQASAGAEAAQMDALRQSLGASGGSIYDPGYQAAQRQAMSQRQGQNLDAMGQLNATAGLANQQAQQQGATQLAAARGAQNAQVNQLGVQGANFRAQTVAETPVKKPRQMSNPLAHVGDNENTGVSASNYAAFR